MPWKNGKYKERITCCKDCDKREVGCHGTCKKYLLSKEEWIKERSRIKEEKRRYHDYINFIEIDGHKRRRGR